MSKSPKSEEPKPEASKSETQKNTTNELASSDEGSPSGYQFAKNPAMSRSWVRNLLFGFAIAMPLSLYGLETELWHAKDLLLIYGIVVVTCLLLLPIYTAIVRELLRGD